MEAVTPELTPAKEPASLGTPAPADGSGSSVHHLYITYAPLLRHLAMRRFNVPATDVDSLVHDVFATYLTDPTRVTSVRPYLVGGICNASRQYWRQRDRDIELVEGDETLVDERTLEKVATRLDIARALSRIGLRCREALRRYYVDGESTPAIAAILETTPGNVNYLLHICRKRARAAFETLTRCI
ncbi:MAG TPA: sigma-70 family RNA polymerase sigma factor [Thermoanaerobaculia bacterium]